MLDRRTSAEEVATTLLVEREKRALRWTAIVRIIYILTIIPLILYVVGEFSEMYALLNLFTAILIAQVVILWSLKKDSKVLSIGLTGAITDALSLCALPVIWHIVYSSESPLIHLTQHNFTAVSLVMIALNGLALRTLYPALVTVTAVVLHGYLAWLGVNDPNISQFGVDRAFDTWISPFDLMVITPFFVCLTGILVTLAAHIARNIVKETVAREQSEYQLREQQLQAVMGAKMEAVGDIVAGLQHEVNSPLGALRSAADTAEKAIAHVRKTHTAEDAEDREQRALSAAENSLKLIHQTSQRLSDVMATIRGFVQLDRADLQRIDFSEILQMVLDKERSSYRDDVEIAVDVRDNMIVEVDPRRIMEALSTVLRNAVDAFDGPGKIEIRLRNEDEWGHIEIQDHGRGIPPELVNHLFEIDFTHGERTHARFGLPLCRSILHGHGGDIEIESKMGLGSTVRIKLPLAV